MTPKIVKNFLLLLLACFFTKSRWNFRNVFWCGKISLPPRLLLCVNFPQCLNLVRAMYVHIKMHIYDDKVFFCALKKLFCMLLCFTFHITHIKREARGGREHGMMKIKKFSICKIFSHTNINRKRGEKEHEKMSHSAMH